MRTRSFDHAERSRSYEILASIFATLFALLRMAVSVLLILAEPLLRVTLVPLAFGGFFVAVVLGGLLQLPGIPIWGLLGLSVASLLAYFLWWRLIHIVMPGSPGKIHAGR